MADQYDQIIKSFRDAVHAYPTSLVGRLSEQAAQDAGRRAARMALAPAIWSEVLGEDRLRTAQVVDLLGISRQAISKRVAAGTLLGLRGDQTTFFPSWQFDQVECEVRPIIGAISGIFSEELGTVDAALIISWASTPQDEDLGGDSPASIIEKGGKPDSVLRAARRAAIQVAS